MGLIYIIVLEFNLACHKGGLASSLFHVWEFCQRKGSLENTRLPNVLVDVSLFAEKLKTHSGEKSIKFCERKPAWKIPASQTIWCFTPLTSSQTIVDTATLQCYLP